MDFLYGILDNTEYAFVTALVLGLMTSISPCPLATNISAIGFISRDIENRRRVFYNGLAYTIGRAFSYTLLAIILYFGASQLNISNIFQGWGEKVLGPLLILMGVFMLGLIKINIPGLQGMFSKVERNGKSGFWCALLLGVVFALAFCPYSGVLYFAMLIPITIASPGGLYLPVVFAIATGLPVIVFAWMLAFAVGRVGALYNSIKIFERWFRRIIAVIFIVVGVYYIYLNYFSA